MEITSIGYSPRPAELARKKPMAQSLGDFGEVLSTAVQQVNELQARADGLATQVALGKNVDLHEAVLASEEASLAFQYTMQVRNKLIEAYQEVMRMSV